MQRATVNFEMAMGRTPYILRALATEEGGQLLNIAAKLSSLGIENQTRDIGDVVEDLEQVVHQLRQYMKMMSEVDSLLHSTVLPEVTPPKPVADTSNADVFQSIQDLKEKLGDVKDFTKLLENASLDLSQDDGGTDGPKEG
jgi:hypothetical protein